MRKHDTKVGAVVILGLWIFSVACSIGCWLLNVYIVVKTAKWLGWL